MNELARLEFELWFSTIQRVKTKTKKTNKLKWISSDRFFSASIPQSEFYMTRTQTWTNIETRQKFLEDMKHGHELWSSVWTLRFSQQSELEILRRSKDLPCVILTYLNSAVVWIILIPPLITLFFNLYPALLVQITIGINVNFKLPKYYHFLWMTWFCYLLVFFYYYPIVHWNDKLHLNNFFFYYL